MRGAATVVGGLPPMRRCITTAATRPQSTRTARAYTTASHRPADNHRRIAKPSCSSRGHLARDTQRLQPGQSPALPSRTASRWGPQGHRRFIMYKKNSVKAFVFGHRPQGRTRTKGPSARRLALPAGLAARRTAPKRLRPQLSRQRRRDGVTPALVYFAQRMPGLLATSGPSQLSHCSPPLSPPQGALVALKSYRRTLRRQGPILSVTPKDRFGPAL